MAVAGNEVVGFLDGGRTDGSPWRPVRATEVRAIFVKEPFRRLGIGWSLMLEFVRWSKTLRVQAIGLGVFSSNKRAIAFYESLGFAPTCVTMERVVGGRE